MNRTDDARSDVIELGVARGIYSDEVLMNSMPGLSDD